jgi:hypothetical protein
MRQEVIRDFLNLPGIAGIALMDGRSHPYFWGLDQTLNPQQKVALSQGILQVVGTIPDGFETFEFQFAKQQKIYIYKLGQQLTLMLLTQGNLATPAYAKAIQQLQSWLQADVAHAVSRLRVVIDELAELDTPPVSPLSLTTASPRPLTTPVPPQPPPPPKTVLASVTSSPLVDSLLSVENLRPIASSPPAASPPATTLQDLLTILNHLGQFATQYIGTAVVVNYLKTTRPADEWASQFQVERTAQITCSDLTLVHQSLHQTEHQLIQTWALAFVQRCSQTIRDFPALVKKVALSHDQRSLLFKKFES